MKKTPMMKLLTSAGIGAALTFGSAVQAADVVIGVPNWPSVLATAHVLKGALEDNLGLEVELQNGTNPDLNSKYVNEKGTVRQNPNGVAGDQAMCVTKSTAERTGIENLSDLTDPDMAKNFDTDDDGKGEIWIGASGWASTNIEKIRAKSYGYAETMQLKEMDESLALAEVDNAVAQDKDIVFFCYTPHHMFALHELVILKEPAYADDKWTVIQPTDDPEWLEKSEAAVAWNTAYLHIHYAASLEESQPEAAKMLSQVKLDTDTVSAMTFALVLSTRWILPNLPKSGSLRMPIL